MDEKSLRLLTVQWGYQTFGQSAHAEKRLRLSAAVVSESLQGRRGPGLRRG